MSGGPALALLARLGEAASWSGKVRDYEPDPWGYLRRKLESTEEPLRALRLARFEAARDGLLRELAEPFLKPGALLDHKEAFEPLLAPADFADLSFHLSPGIEPAARRAGAAEILAHARPRTSFDIERLPPERRPKDWEKLVAQLHDRLGLPALAAILARRERTPFRLAMTARRVRRQLAEYLAVTRHEHGARDELTPFVLTRLEALVAALLRFLR
ncbi:MAG: hypothetical protein SF051_06795 [Elusimicrobiota bacterium]|nr:hypothetical protein [Elusimicrobiota bacterium]